MPAAVALAVTLTSIAAVILATARARGEIDPTLRSLDRLRADLRPALVAVRADRDRSRRLG